MSDSGAVPGPALRELRERLGLDARDVAAAMRVTPQRVYNIEARAAVGPSTAARIHNALRTAAQERRKAVRELYGEAS